MDERATPLDPRPFVAIALCVTMWGLSGILVKSVDMHPLVASFYRLWFGVAVLWLATIARGAARRRLSWQWLRLCAAGGVLFGVHQIFFFQALHATRVANVTIIAALQPALVTFVAARWFGEPVAWRSLPYLALAFAGVATVMVATDGQPGVAPHGNLLALINLFAFTAYFLASKRIRDDLGSTEYITGMTTVAALVMSATLLVFDLPPTPPALRDAGALLIIAVFPGAVGHTLMAWAHPLLSAFTISSMILVVPVLSSLAAVVLIAEPLLAWQVAGGSLALVGVAAILRDSARAASPAIVLVEPPDAALPGVDAGGDGGR